MNSESWILITVQCVIYQWICLDKLYKLMYWVWGGTGQRGLGQRRNSKLLFQIRLVWFFVFYGKLLWYLVSAPQNTFNSIPILYLYSFYVAVLYDFLELGGLLWPNPPFPALLDPKTPVSHVYPYCCELLLATKSVFSKLSGFAIA